MTIGEKFSSGLGRYASFFLLAFYLAWKSFCLFMLTVCLAIFLPVCHSLVYVARLLRGWLHRKTYDET